MVQRPKIPHFKPQVVDNIILEGQGRGNFMDLQRPPEKPTFLQTVDVASL